MRNRQRLLVLAAVMSIVASACGGATATQTANPTGTPPAGQTVAPTEAPKATPTPVTNFPRNETLYTTGKQWGAPSTWNPLDPNSAMGVVGLQYETLFLYDPLKDVYTPWLATKGEWDSAKTSYTITVRDGVKWSDGQDFTAKDVAFTINLGLNVKALGSALPQMVSSATASADNKQVVVKFKDNPAYQEWQQWVYNSPIVPEHIWTSKANENILKETNKDGVGTGPYKFLAASDDRMVWQKNDGWWATAALKLDVKPKYVVDIVNSSNNVALGGLLQGTTDLSNNFLPGIAQVITGGYGITTYFDKPPYMLAGNTAVLVPNTKKAPLDDKAFRKALATSINVDDIVNKVYGGIVTKADPTGLLPIFNKYVDGAQRDQLGFSFNTAKAKQMLAAAGYKDTNNDGCVEKKDGSALKLVLEVPDGWSDWMAAENSIAASAKAAGICIDPQHPDYNTNVADRNRPDAGGVPKFDLVINNDVQVGNTPWTWYDYVFRLPLINGAAENRNFEGYENQTAWGLVQQLDKTPVEDLAKMKDLAKQLQNIQLTDMPVIPLWYNGLWSQVNNSVWTNWPSDKGAQVLPATWNGYWQMGSILMLTNLQLAKK